MAPSAIHEPVIAATPPVSPSAQKSWTDNGGYTIPERPLGTRRQIRILVIGFGASAINISRVFGLPPDNNIEVQCYDKNPELGGTWYENTYPGCACDIVRIPFSSVIQMLELRHGLSLNSILFHCHSPSIIY